MGGKSLEGFYSYYEAVRELSAADVPIDYLFIACGTGTTLTGVCAGMQKYYPEAKVYAISVARELEDEMPVLLSNMQVLNEYIGTNYDFDNLIFCDIIILQCSIASNMWRYIRKMSKKEKPNEH